MNARKILISTVLLVAAIATIVFVNLLSSSRPSTDSLRFYQCASENAIGSVILRDGSDQTKLLRRGDVWMMVPNAALAATASGGGLSSVMGKEAASGEALQTKPATGSAAREFPADSGAINQLLETLVKIRKSTLVSENPAKQATFEVDSLHGTRIEAFDLAGRSLGAVILGKSSPDYGSNYFRPDNSDQVFLVPESNRWSLTADPKHWEDKTIMKFDQAQVGQFTIAKKGSPALVIARGDSLSKGWRLVEGGKIALDSNKAENVLHTLSNLQAEKFEDSPCTDSTTGLVDPPLTLTINFKGGSSRIVAIGNKKPGQNKYWLKIPEKPYIYLIDDWVYTQLDKKPQDLANLPPKPGKPGKLPPRAPTFGKIKIPGKK